MNSNPQKEYNVYNKIQLSGILQKKNINNNSGSNRWSKRFFVIRDGYLFYYPENEKKEFEKRKHFNLHPKGLIPLGHCIIEPLSQNHKHAISIKSDEFVHPFVLAIDNLAERDKWLKKLQEASRITWHNSQIGETLIKELEKQGLYLWKEQEKVKEKLHTETLAHQIEVNKNDELKKIALDLETEKRNLEKMIEDLKENYDKVKCELDNTISVMENLENNNPKLDQTIHSLQNDIESLTLEKSSILTELMHREEDVGKQSLENQSLSLIVHELRSSLKNVENKIDFLTKEKANSELVLQENKNTSLILHQEKEMYTNQAHELVMCLKELWQQKFIAEQELKEEILARLDARQKLVLAETSLHHLDAIITDRHFSLTDAYKDDMISNVKKLKKFFEDLDQDGKQKINNGFLGSTLHARKAVIKRAETIRCLTLPRRRMRIKNETFLAFDGSAMCDKLQMSVNISNSTN